MNQTRLISLLILGLNIIILGISIYLILKNRKTEKYQPISKIPQDVMTYKILTELSLKELNEFALANKQQNNEVNRYLSKLYGNSKNNEEEQKIANQILKLEQELENIQKENQIGLSTINKIIYYYQTVPSEKGEKYLRMLEEIFKTIGAKFVSLRETKDKGKILMVDYSNLPFVYSDATKRDKTLPIGLRISYSPYYRWDDPENAVTTGIVGVNHEIWWQLEEEKKKKYINIMTSISDIIKKYDENWILFFPRLKSTYGTNYDHGVISNSKTIKMAYPNEGYNLFHTQLIGIGLKDNIIEEDEKEKEKEIEGDPTQNEINIFLKLLKEASLKDVTKVFSQLKEIDNNRKYDLGKEIGSIKDLLDSSDKSNLSKDYLEEANKIIIRNLNLFTKSNIIKLIKVLNNI